MPTAITLLTAAIVLFTSSSSSSSSPSSSPSSSSSPGVCAPGETGVVVETRSHRMHLCKAGQIERTFQVALGSRGVGKQKRGDWRTPLGSYGLGSPRASKDFHIFVPVGYPTPAQARMGFTGSAIGIHGPPRGYGTLAELAALVSRDWTAGCIAVATEDDIKAVAAWIRKQGVKNVRLEI